MKVMPKGSGGVHCLDCDAHAAADGKGSGIVLIHNPDCIQLIPRPLHENPCPGCGLEPEVVRYYRRISDKVRVGYDCTCGAHVIDGVVIHMGAGS